MADARSSSSPGRPTDAKALAEAAAEPRLARFRRAVRRDLQALQGRLLRHRSDAVQPGRGHRHRGRERARAFTPAKSHHETARCLVRLTCGEVGRRPAHLLVSDQRDWHARQMEAAFTRARRPSRAHRSLPMRVRHVAAERALSLPGFGSRLPDAVHRAHARRQARSRRSRSVSASCTRCAKLGVVVWNDARAIERCVDKSMTSFLLQQAGVPTPPTWTIEDRGSGRAPSSNARRGAARWCSSPCSARREGLAPDSAHPTICRPRKRSAGSTICSSFTSSGDRRLHDYRLFVLRGRVVAAMMRHGRDAGSPTSSRAARLRPSRRSRDGALAIAAAAAVGAEICGRRHARGADGAPTVLEVNSMPAWSGLQKVSRSTSPRALARASWAGLRHGRRACRPLHERGADDRIAGAAYVEACLAELDAPKPGNVHVFAAATAWRSRTSFAAPRRRRADPWPGRGAGSESASAPRSRRPWRRSAQNTNLGIMLLCAPLAAAAEARMRLCARRFARGCSRLSTSGRRCDVLFRHSPRRSRRPRTQRAP